MQSKPARGPCSGDRKHVQPRWQLHVKPRRLLRFSPRLEVTSSRLFLKPPWKIAPPTASASATPGFQRFLTSQRLG
jgi:hypothetical protein